MRELLHAGLRFVIHTGCEATCWFVPMASILSPNEPSDKTHCSHLVSVALLTL
jgi:hypothetical protein